MQRNIEVCGYTAACLGIMLAQFMAFPTRAQHEGMISIGVLLIMTGLVVAMLARRAALKRLETQRDPLSTVHASSR